MGFFHEYPYTDFHEINLDWILHQIMKLHKEYDEFKAVNTITNAGAWDITKQYQAWTIVSDNNAGYISLQPVPAGIAISNTDYWGLIADYDILITDLSSRITALETAMTTLNEVADRADRSLKNRKIVFVGDSFAHSGGSSSWLETVMRILNMGSSRCVSIDYPGYGFSTPGLKWIDLCSGPNGFPGVTIDHDLITDVYILGGTNDVGISMATILQDISDFKDYTLSQFPYATIHIGFLGWIPSL